MGVRSSLKLAEVQGTSDKSNDSAAEQMKAVGQPSEIRIQQCPGLTTDAIRGKTYLKGYPDEL